MASAAQRARHLHLPPVPGALHRQRQLLEQTDAALGPRPSGALLARARQPLDHRLVQLGPLLGQPLLVPVHDGERREHDGVAGHAGDLGHARAPSPARHDGGSPPPGSRGRAPGSTARGRSGRRRPSERVDLHVGEVRTAPPRPRTRRPARHDDAAALVCARRCSRSAGTSDSRATRSGASSRPSSSTAGTALDLARGRSRRRAPSPRRGSARPGSEGATRRRLAVGGRLADWPRRVSAMCSARSDSRTRIGNRTIVEPEDSCAASGASPSRVRHSTWATRRRKVVLPAPGSPTTTSAALGERRVEQHGHRPIEARAAEPCPRRERPGFSRSSRARVVVSDM